MHRRSSRCCWRCTLHTAAHAAVVAALQQLYQRTARKNCARLQHPSRRPPPSTVYIGDADADVYGCLLGAVSRRASSKIAFCFSSRLHSFCTGGRRKVAHDGHMAMNGIEITAWCAFGIVKLT